MTSGEGPYFLCGALRSGTTLTRIMIDHHPRISNYGETDYLFEFEDKRDGAADVDGYRRFLTEERAFYNSGLSLPDSGNIADLVRGLAEQMRDGERTLTITIHRNFRRILQIFPDARIVHLVRDPRDVARSSIGMGWNGNVYHGVDHWIKSEQEMAVLKAEFPDAPVLRVRYEDLVSDAEGELGRICRFYGDDFDPRMFDYAATSTYDLPDASFAAQWKRKLSARELGLLEGKLGPMLAEAGYAPSGAPVIRPGWRERQMLRLEDRLGRLKRRIKRQGIWLIAMEMIGRRLGIDGLRRAAKRRMVANDLKYLK